MRSKYVVKSVALTIVLLPLAWPGIAPHAQTSPQQQLLLERGPLPEAVEVLVNRKKEQITQEVANEPAKLAAA
ncbi:MAG: hypothetical protein ACRD6N_02795 [Pyrinomonadaceae bacterium]